MVGFASVLGRYDVNIDQNWKAEALDPNMRKQPGTQRPRGFSEVWFHLARETVIV